jgi:hypothetical protein
MMFANTFYCQSMVMSNIGSLEMLVFLTYNQINVRIPRVIDTAKRYVSLEWKKKHFNMPKKKKKQNTIIESIY